MSAFLTSWSRVWPELMSGLCRSRVARTLMGRGHMHELSERGPAMSAHQKGFVSLRVFPKIHKSMPGWDLHHWEQAQTAIFGKANTKNSFGNDAN
jgi:hypothetical protein